MYRLLPCLFSVVDCGFWDNQQIVSWSNCTASNARNPQKWIIDLSTSTSENESLTIIRQAMKDFNQILPEDIGDLMVGLHLLHFDAGAISVEEFRYSIIDVIDAYGTTGLDVEKAARIIPSDISFGYFRTVAENAINSISTKSISEADHSIIEV